MTRNIGWLSGAVLASVALVFAGCGDDDSTSTSTGVVEAFLKADPDARCDFITDPDSGEGQDICSQFSDLPAYPDATATEDDCGESEDYSTGEGCSVDASFEGMSGDFVVAKTDDGYSIDYAYNVVEGG